MLDFVGARSKLECQPLTRKCRGFAVFSLKKILFSILRNLGSMKPICTNKLLSLPKRRVFTINQFSYTPTCLALEKYYEGKTLPPLSTACPMIVVSVAMLKCWFFWLCPKSKISPLHPVTEMETLNEEKIVLSTLQLLDMCSTNSPNSGGINRRKTSNSRGTAKKHIFGPFFNEHKIVFEVKFRVRREIIILFWKRNSQSVFLIFLWHFLMHLKRKIWFSKKLRIFF